LSGDSALNDRQNTKQFREGFVDPEKPVPVTNIPEPEIAKSPSEDDILMEDKWPIVVKLLYKPVTNNNGERVQELSFREPRGGDINRYGNPVRINQEGDVMIDERKMHFMMSALADVLPPFLEAMDPRDWNSCAYRLRRFFLPDPRAW
jgi:hypothetical protein